MPHGHDRGPVCEWPFSWCASRHGSDRQPVVLYRTRRSHTHGVTVQASYTARKDLYSLDPGACVNVGV